MKKLIGLALLLVLGSFSLQADTVCKICKTDQTKDAVWIALLPEAFSHITCAPNPKLAQGSGTPVVSWQGKPYIFKTVKDAQNYIAVSSTTLGIPLCNSTIFGYKK